MKINDIVWLMISKMFAYCTNMTFSRTTWIHIYKITHILRAIVIMMLAKCCVLIYIIWQQNSRKLCDAWFLNHTRCFIVGFISSDINYVKNKNFKMKLKSWRITCTRRQKFDVTSNFTCMIMYNNCITFLTRYRNHRMKQT